MTDAVTVRANGKAEMAYVGAAPWHRLGQELKQGASLKEWTQAAGFDFDVLPAEVLYKPANEKAVKKVDDRVVLYRSDSHEPLSIVSTEYKVVQPQDILKYFNDLVQKGGFSLETAGTLFGGKQFWGLATIGEEAAIADKKDKVKGRLLVSTSVDGSMATTCKFVCERVVCHNTLTFALGERDGTTVKVRHRKTFNASEVNAELGIEVRGRFQQAIEQFRKLAETRMSPEDMVKATVELYKPDAYKLAKEDLLKVLKGRALNAIGALAVENKTIGHELSGVNGTAWGWLNAVTQYIDHDNGSRTDDRRLQRAWFGTGEVLKSRALEIAVASADGATTYTHEYEMGNSALLDAVLAQPVPQS